MDELEALSGNNSLSGVIRLAASDVGRGRQQSPPDFSTVTFCQVVQSLYAGSAELPPTCGELAATEAAIPAEMRAGLSQIIAAAGWAAQQRNSMLPPGVSSANFDILMDYLHALVVPHGTVTPDPYAWRNLLLDPELDAVYEAAAVLAEVIDDALVGPTDPETVIEVVLDSPLGSIVIRGDAATDADQTYCNDSVECSGIEGGVVLDQTVLLFIDTGGNDTYLVPAGATQGHAHAVSVFIDLSGDDRYGYTETEILGPEGILPPADIHGRLLDPNPPLSRSLVSRQGASRGGIGFLIDRGQGSDDYQSLRMSQGFGMLGVGALVDDGCQTEGDVTCEDAFRSESLSQKAGLLIENGGNDQYGASSPDTLGKVTLPAAGYEPSDNPRRQARTVGLFVDAGGSDTYSGRGDNPAIANDSFWVQQDRGTGGEEMIEWGIGLDGEGGTGVRTIE